MCDPFAHEIGTRSDSEPRLFAFGDVFYRRGSKQISPIGQPDLECVADRPARPRLESADGHGRARLDIAFRPTGPQQRVRRSHLEPPAYNFAVGALDVDKQPRVRI